MKIKPLLERIKFIVISFMILLISDKLLFQMVREDNKMDRDLKKILRLLLIGVSVFVLLLLLLPLANASTYSEIRETATNITDNQTTTDYQIYKVDLFLWTLNNGSYNFSYSSKVDLKVFWETGRGDCTELARAKHIMYKSIGLKSRIVHGCIMVNNKCSKHDYVEYKINKTWESTEHKYYTYPLIKRGWGIW